MSMENKTVEKDWPDDLARFGLKLMLIHGLVFGLIFGLGGGFVAGIWHAHSTYQDIIQTIDKTHEIVLETERQRAMNADAGRWKTDPDTGEDVFVYGCESEAEPLREVPAGVRLMSN